MTKTKRCVRLASTCISISDLDFHTPVRFRTFCRARDHPALIPPRAAAIVQTAWSSWTPPPSTLRILFGNTLMCAAYVSYYCSSWHPSVLLFIRLQLTSVSLSSNSFGRIHLVAEIFDIILRSNYKVHTLWCNNNVFTGIQTRQRFAVSDKKSSEEESYARTTLNAARSKLQAAVHVYVNEHIKPKSKLVKVVPDAGASPFPFVLHSSAPTILHNL